MTEAPTTYLNYQQIMNSPLVTGIQTPQDIEDSRIAKLREARRAARAARESLQVDDKQVVEHDERRSSTGNALQNASQVQYQVCQHVTLIRVVFICFTRQHPVNFR